MTKTIKAYKLCRLLKDGSISPLFINKKKRLPIGEWMEAESHPTKGFAVRPFWHCCSETNAPHLSKKNRTWVEVEIKDYDIFNRPAAQGGTWYLARKMKVIRILQEDV